MVKEYQEWDLAVFHDEKGPLLIKRVKSLTGMVNETLKCISKTETWALDAINNILENEFDIEDAFEKDSLFEVASIITDLLEDYDEKLFLSEDNFNMMLDLNTDREFKFNMFATGNLFAFAKPVPEEEYIKIEEHNKVIKNGC